MVVSDWAAVANGRTTNVNSLLNGSTPNRFRTSHSVERPGVFSPAEAIPASTSRKPKTILVQGFLTAFFPAGVARVWVRTVVSFPSLASQQTIEKSH